MDSEPYDSDSSAPRDLESGYASGSSSAASIPDVYFTKPHLKFLNQQLQKLEPEAILRWSIITLPNLFQTTAFGLTGLVTVDMLSKINSAKDAPQIDLIFLDTLYHFQETLDLVDRVKHQYPRVNLHIYKPQAVDTASEFEAKHGEHLWETNEDLYDWVAKVEPAQRAYAELQVKAVLTGRRRSQGGKRGDLDIIEVDDAGLIKINPLANWSFKQVQDYIKEHNVPYNQLLDMGYKSIGDWHSTQPIKEGEDERAGRWKGTTKTECGIHNSRSKYAQFLRDQEAKKQLQQVQQQEETITQAFEGKLVIEPQAS